MIYQTENQLAKSMAQIAGILEKMNSNEKVVASGQTAGTLFDAAGIFNVPGIDPTVLSAYVRPWQSIATVLPPPMPNNVEIPLFAALTGFTADDGTQPELICDPAPTADMKSCLLTAQYGVVRYDTKTIEPQQILKQLSAGINTELNLVGEILGIDNVTVSGLNPDQVVDMVTVAAMVTAAVQAERNLVAQFWQGVVTATNQFPGLDVQIATGQVDSRTNQACTAMDSDVKDFNYNDIATGALDIAAYLAMLEFYLRTNAAGMGLDVEWIICMRPNLWQVLTEIWPIKYNTLPVTLRANERINLSGRENRQDTDEMRRSKIITINSNDYQVVPDVGIFESNNANDANVPAGSFASSIYMVPLRANGQLVTYREHLDYRPWSVEVARMDKQDFWTDDGIYSWALDKKLWCHTLSLKTEQRIICRHPGIAGRIDNVLYTPIQHTREPFPASPYHFDGGVSTRSSGETTYAVWGDRTV
jgi:hypothetical protein